MLGQRCWCQSGSITVYAEIDDLSEGGAFVRTFAPLREGSKASLQWTLPGSSNEIEAEAVVVWSRPKGTREQDPPAGMGVRFARLDPADRARIRNFVAAGLDEQSA